MLRAVAGLRYRRAARKTTETGPPGGGAGLQGGTPHQTLGGGGCVG